MPSLVEVLGSFATSRNQSSWVSPSVVTSMAAMLWSRIIIVKSATANLDRASLIYKGLNGTKFSLADVGVIYPVNDTVFHNRPTMQKSGSLYCVFALQPLLTMIILVLILMFHSTPLDKGFGLISILSGIDRGSFDTLAGAALSG